MSPTIKINSSSQWRQTLSSNSVVIADFYADWCGPCKMIAPTFESLSTKFSKPGKIAFAKVDTDSQQDIAMAYSVRAMPTFLVLHGGKVVQTIQGANPPALSAAVSKAVKLAGSGGGASFGSGGRTLGGSDESKSAGGPGRTAGSAAGLARPLKWDLNNLINALILIVGLYLVSLFSFDAYKSAENSQFNVKNPVGPAPPAGQGGGPAGAKPAPKATFKTLSDLGAN